MKNPFKKELPINGLQTRDARENEFRFERTYTLPLTDKATLVMVINQNIMMSYYATLYQPNGKSIRFDYDAVARDIIDPELVPLVKAGVSQILKEDKAYRKLPKQTLIDSHGNTWIKETK
jgi:hypothetical protein